jgi:hypothetical protein
MAAEHRTIALRPLGLIDATPPAGHHPEIHKVLPWLATGVAP